MKRIAKQNVFQLMRLNKYNGGYSSKIMDILRISHSNNKVAFGLRDDYLSMVVGMCNNTDTPLYLLYKGSKPLVFISIDYISKTILSIIPIDSIEQSRFSLTKYMFLSLYMLVKGSSTLSINRDVLTFRMNRRIKNKRLKLANYYGGNDYRYEASVSKINSIGKRIFNKILNG